MLTDNELDAIRARINGAAVDHGRWVYENGHSDVAWDYVAYFIDRTSWLIAEVRWLRTLAMATCAWRENDDGIWNTSCGLAWCFECGGLPAEHGMQYCPRCGRGVVVNDAD